MALKEKDKREVPEEKIQQQLKIIHKLAKRLPWLVVIVILLAAVFTILQIYFNRS